MNETFLQRPNPFPRESALGWALRAAELNGLPNAMKLVTLCKNFNTTTSLVKFNPAELADWFDKAPSKLRFMSYKSLRQNSPLLFRMQPVTPKMLNLRTPRICPLCVEKDGYIHAFWDLDLVSVCPTHHVTLTFRCSTCRKHLRWNRPGLLTCGCGARIKQDGIQASKAMAAMHQQLEIVAYGKQTKTSVHLGCGNGALKNISLRFLINFIEISARINIQKRHSRMALSMPEKLQLLEKSAELLSEWPENFSDFLSLLNQKPFPKSKGVGLFEKRLLHHYIETLFSTPEDFMEGEKIFVTLIEQILDYPNSTMYSELPFLSIWYSRQKDTTYLSASDVNGAPPWTIPKWNKELNLNGREGNAVEEYTMLDVKNRASHIEYLTAKKLNKWAL